MAEVTITVKEDDDLLKKITQQANETRASSQASLLRERGSSNSANARVRCPPEAGEGVFDACQKCAASLKGCIRAPLADGSTEAGKPGGLSHLITCGHVICARCMQACKQTRQEQNERPLYECPLCEEYGAINKLPGADAVNLIACDFAGCAGESLEQQHYCGHCESFVCEDCRPDHLERFPNHELVIREERIVGAAREFAGCAIHQLPVEYRCDCGEMMCACSCAYNYVSHVPNAPEIIVHRRTRMDEVDFDLEDAIENSAGVVKRIHAMRSLAEGKKTELENNMDCLSNEIALHFNQIIIQAIQRCFDVLEGVRAVGGAHHAALERQLALLERTERQITVGVELDERGRCREAVRAESVSQYVRNVAYGVCKPALEQLEKAQEFSSTLEAAPFELSVPPPLTRKIMEAIGRWGERVVSNAHDIALPASEFEIARTAVIEPKGIMAATPYVGRLLNGVERAIEAGKIPLRLHTALDHFTELYERRFVSQTMPRWRGDARRVLPFQVGRRLAPEATLKSNQDIEDRQAYECQMMARPGMIHLEPKIFGGIRRIYNLTAREDVSASEVQAAYSKTPCLAPIWSTGDSAEGTTRPAPRLIRPAATAAAGPAPSEQEEEAMMAQLMRRQGGATIVSATAISAAALAKRSSVGGGENSRSGTPHSAESLDDDREAGGGEEDDDDIAILPTTTCSQLQRQPPAAATAAAVIKKKKLLFMKPSAQEEVAVAACDSPPNIGAMPRAVPLPSSGGGGVIPAANRFGAPSILRRKPDTPAPKTLFRPATSAERQAAVARVSTIAAARQSLKQQLQLPAGGGSRGVVRLVPASKLQQGAAAAPGPHRSGNDSLRVLQDNLAAATRAVRPSLPLPPPGTSGGGGGSRSVGRPSLGGLQRPQNATAAAGGGVRFVPAVQTRSIGGGGGGGMNRWNGGVSSSPSTSRRDVKEELEDDEAPADDPPVQTLRDLFDVDSGTAGGQKKQSISEMLEDVMQQEVREPSVDPTRRQQLRQRGFRESEIDQIINREQPSSSSSSQLPLSIPPGLRVVVPRARPPTLMGAGGGSSTPGGRAFPPVSHMPFINRSQPLARPVGRPRLHDGPSSSAGLGGKKKMLAIERAFTNMFGADGSIIPEFNRRRGRPSKDDPTAPSNILMNFRSHATQWPPKFEEMGETEIAELQELIDQLDAATREEDGPAGSLPLFTNGGAVKSEEEEEYEDDLQASLVSPWQQLTQQDREQIKAAAVQKLQQGNRPITSGGCFVCALFREHEGKGRHWQCNECVRIGRELTPIKDGELVHAPVAHIPHESKKGGGGGSSGRRAEAGGGEAIATPLDDHLELMMRLGMAGGVGEGDEEEPVKRKETRGRKKKERDPVDEPMTPREYRKRREPAAAVAEEEPEEEVVVGTTRRGRQIKMPSKLKGHEMAARGAPPTMTAAAARRSSSIGSEGASAETTPRKETRGRKKKEVAEMVEVKEEEEEDEEPISMMDGPGKKRRRI